MVALPFTIIERGEQNRPGGPISTTKLVPLGTNLVAVLVPRGGSNLANWQIWYDRYIRTYAYVFQPITTSVNGVCYVV